MVSKCSRLNWLPEMGPTPFVIPSEARNLSSILLHEKEERFLASLGMTK
jgi:hypothetical protein